MDDWLKPALDYIPQWLEYQMRETEQPGCVIAIVHKGRVVLERAFGHADIVARTPLTPRHRFRVASHSKTFTAAGWSIRPLAGYWLLASDLHRGTGPQRSLTARGTLRRGRRTH